MLEFPINWTILFEINYNERKRAVRQLKLSDEWTIVCVLNEPLLGTWIVSSIEIHRKKTDQEFLVSGELTIRKDYYPNLKKKFSEFIKTGSSIIEIWSDINRLYYYPQNVLKGLLKISDVSEKQPTNIANEELKEKVQLISLGELSNDFERLLQPESSCFADVTLKCDGVSIPAHKIILSARSPVFAAMFANPMKESLRNEVVITDIDEPILQAMLRYMYSGKASTPSVSWTADLLYAADKYQIQGLKTVCSYFLKGVVSLQNVWRILVLGDMHSDDLKSFAVDYICNKFTVIENTQEWKALRKERPDLAKELLKSLVKYRDIRLR